ncbi:hypothetical protein HanRHA438_Chr15g0708581 [Helianthus annuus]|nr:hypothetical protein HanRHA438_Chr15g0708581 [Helianthus annuus]
MMLLSDLFVSSRCFRHRLGCDRKVETVAYGFVRRLRLKVEVGIAHVKESLLIGPSIQ